MCIHNIYYKYAVYVLIRILFKAVYNKSAQSRRGFGYDEFGRDLRCNKSSHTRGSFEGQNFENLLSRSC